MTNETIPFDCPSCGKKTMGLQIKLETTLNGPYVKMFCCNCHFFVHVPYPIVVAGA